MCTVCVYGWCVCVCVCMVSVCVHGECKGMQVQVIQYSNILMAGQCGIPKQRVNFCFGLPLSKTCIYSHM